MVAEDTIAVVEGNLKTNITNGEVGVMTQSIKTLSITNARLQAQEMGLFDETQKANLL